MLYTRKGDQGTTKVFSCDQRISKSSALAEALGSLDETNSFLGLVKSKCGNIEFQIEGDTIKAHDTVEIIQQDLFIVAAVLAGAPKEITEAKVKFLENVTDSIEKVLPPINSFFVPGASELSAYFDVARTIARRAERRCIAVSEEGTTKLGEFTLPYLNRLSSALYALARISNYKNNAQELKPTYE